MKMSYIVCKNCYAVVPQPYLSRLPMDDEEKFDALLQKVRDAKITCPSCGGHKWIRKVASKV